MVKELKDLIKPKLTAYEMAEEIVKLGCYNGICEPYDLVSQMTVEEISNMHTIGMIVEKYPQLWDRE